MGRLARPKGSPTSRTRSSRRSGLRGQGDPAGRDRARARGRVPDGDRRGLKELGLFGLMIPEEYGGLGESLLTYALAVEEIARGWMSVTGIINTHFIVAYMLLAARHRRAEAEVPAADGDRRGARRVLDVGAGLRLGRGGDQDQGRPRTATTTSITGQKMWLTNGGSSNLVAVLVKTDEGADSVYRNMTTFLVEKERGLRRDRAGRHHPGQDREDGLQGRRHHRDGVRRPPDLRPTRSSAASPARASTR